MKTRTVISIVIVATILTNCIKTERAENPEISTTIVTDISVNSAKSGGKISNDGSLPVIERGVCWSLKQYPTISDNHSADSSGFGTFKSELVNLNGDSTYYIRAYYTNAKDTVYGNQVKFRTRNYIIFNAAQNYGTVTDYDGNTYKTVRIGSQTWMAENLRVTHFQNGDPIPDITDPRKWNYFEIKSEALCWYKNDTLNKKINGALYNWYSASDERNIAPAGWHVPSASEWEILAKYCSNNNFENYSFKLKEISTAHWRDKVFLESDATNETGFTAIPSGMNAGYWGFINAGFIAYYWTSTGTMDGSSSVYIYGKIYIASMQPNCRGYSIRCIKD